MVRTSGALISVGFVTILAGCAQPALYQTSVPAPELSSLALTVQGAQLLDADGRTVLMHGADCGGQSKRPPYFPFAFQESGIPGEENAPPFVQAAQDFANIVAGWGLNLVRVLFLWEALEPTQGTYDTVYLSRVQMLAQDFGNLGIRVILDNHQDVYATVFCGEGFPLWTLNGYSAQAPSSCDPWYQGYLGQIPDMSAAFDRLYPPGPIQSAFIAMWQYVAQFFAHDTEVVAFEILNEPFYGTTDEQTWVNGPLKTFWETVGAAIRQEAPGANLVFDGPPTVLVNNVVEAAPPDGGGWIFGPHYYEPEAYVLGPDLSMNWLQMTQLIQPIAAVSSSWNVPVWFGEFGIVDSAMNSGNYLSFSWDAFDSYLDSASVWHFSTTPDLPQEQMDIWVDGGEAPDADACVRPYPSAVAGTLQSFAFNQTTGVAKIVLDAKAGGVTEMVVPTRRYPRGPSLSLSGAHLHYEYDAGAQRLRFMAPSGGNVTLTLSP